MRELFFVLVLLVQVVVLHVKHVLKDFLTESMIIPSSQRSVLSMPRMKAFLPRLEKVAKKLSTICKVDFEVHGHIYKDIMFS